jgi:DNA excision repair protein ERCC-5
MGVNNLWKLLAPCGRRVAIESLAYKALAIDASIWLTQFVKAMRDDEGKMIANAHIIGTFRRVVQLLMNRVIPIFVFDGATPALKLRTIRQRQRRRQTHEMDYVKQARKLLANQLRARELQLKQRKAHKGGGSADPGGVNTATASLAPGFELPDDNRSTQTNANIGAAGGSAAGAHSLPAAAINVEEDMEWETVPPTTSGDHTTVVDDDDEGVVWEGGDDDADWEGGSDMVVPANADEMDEAALLALPAEMQKTIIDQVCIS